MAKERATVTCRVCSFEETFTKLETARLCLEDHRAETGHEAVWELHQLSSGVERAGADAGVCGRPERGRTHTPLVPSRDPEN